MSNNPNFRERVAGLAPLDVLLQYMGLETSNQGRTYFLTLSTDNCAEVASRVLSSVQRLYPLDTLYNFQVCQLLRIGASFPTSIVERIAISDERLSLSDTVILRPLSDEGAFNKAALYHCAAYASSLHIEARVQGATDEFTTLLEAAAEHYKKIRRLTIIWMSRGSKESLAALSNLITSIGQSVHRLELHLGPNPTVSIGFTRKVIMTIASSCHEIEEVAYSGSSIQLLMPLWKPIGRNLTSLEMKCPPNLSWDDTLLAISTSCTNLTKIFINGIPPAKYEDILCRYGTQLLSTKLIDEQTSIPKCSKIRLACPNARFEVMTETSIDQLVELNNSISDLRLRINDTEGIENLLKSLAVCSDRLERICLELWVCEDLISRIFAHSMPQLISLIMPCLPALNEDTLNPIARATGALRVMKLRFVGLKNTTALEELCKANTNLEDVFVHVLGTMSCLQQKKTALGIVKSMSGCKKLKSLVLASDTEMQNSSSPSWVDCLPEITNACLPLRQNCAIRVFGVQLEY